MIPNGSISWQTTSASILPRRPMPMHPSSRFPRRPGRVWTGCLRLSRKRRIGPIALTKARRCAIRSTVYSLSRAPARSPRAPCGRGPRPQAILSRSFLRARWRRSVPFRSMASRSRPHIRETASPSTWRISRRTRSSPATSSPRWAPSSRATGSMPGSPISTTTRRVSPSKAARGCISPTVRGRSWAASCS